MKKIQKIGFWGYPHPDIIKQTKTDYPSAEWIDLDIDFGYPKTNILPDSYCKIIRNIYDNSLYIKPDLIIAPIGKDKCDSGWFAYRLLKDMGFYIIPSVYESVHPIRDIKICKSNIPLYEKFIKITGGIINEEVFNENYETSCIPERENNIYSNPDFTPGFWGVPPNDMNILKLFPANTHIYGWTRCVEAGCPANLELEMYVNPSVPTVFYAQAFCSKTQLAKYLADKYNGLYIDIDDYANNSVKAKIEAFLQLS